MGRDVGTERPGRAEQCPAPQFGWRPDTDPAIAAAPSPGLHGPRPVASSAPPGVTGPRTTAVIDLPPPLAAPDLSPWLQLDVDQPAPPRDRAPAPRSSRSRPALVGKGLVHAFVLVVIGLVVLGHGYWDRSRQVVQPGGVDMVGDLGLNALPGTQAASGVPVSVSYAFAGGSDALSGYVSELASAAVPSQLNVQVVTAKAGQSIADLAEQTGRSIETLLWANGLSDPARPLDPGTQVRVPPVDGMLHVVHDGDTLESIAARYQVKPEAITGYAPNNVQSSADLVPLRMIMVPGGKMPTRDHVVTYTVREGDTLATIAQLFGLSPDTIVWANSLPNGDLIFPGQHLAILPTDGVMVTVKDGDTVQSLAKRYGVDAKKIVDYPANGLGAGGQLRVGQQVMIPGGTPPAPPPPPPAPAPAAPAPRVADTRPAAPPPPPPPPPSRGATGHLIWPCKGVITQYFGPTSFWMEPPYAGYAHFHTGLDIANGLYTPIVAADGGTVIFAGWNTHGLGNAVAIDHGNGLVTWYGHMAERPAVVVGQHVSQGQYLGPMGSTGASTGSHTHFVVIKNGVYQNPLDYLR